MIFLSKSNWVKIQYCNHRFYRPAQIPTPTPSAWPSTFFPPALLPWAVPPRNRAEMLTRPSTRSDQRALGYRHYGWKPRHQSLRKSYGRWLSRGARHQARGRFLWISMTGLSLCQRMWQWMFSRFLWFKLYIKSLCKRCMDFNKLWNVLHITEHPYFHIESL